MAIKSVSSSADTTSIAVAPAKVAPVGAAVAPSIGPAVNVTLSNAPATESSSSSSDSH